MKLLIGTNNVGKVDEIRSVLHGLGLHLITPLELSLQINPDETGTTYTENALIKARAFFAQSHRTPTVTEDAGIDVSSLPGELGVHTRRWGAGPLASDTEWIAHFLDRMHGVTDRGATFHSAVAFIDADGNEMVFEGRCEGTITENLETAFPVGLPFEGCFRPHGFNTVYGALSRDEKNCVSHRGKALMGLRQYLLEHCGLSWEDDRP